MTGNSLKSIGNALGKGGDEKGMLGGSNWKTREEQTESVERTPARCGSVLHCTSQKRKGKLQYTPENSAEKLANNFTGGGARRRRETRV